ncbi:MAG: type I restriction endonuclease subunit R, partial [Gammaproteobacteria bacterium]
NRVKEGKNNGLVVDYCGILKNLRKALATFAGHTGGPSGGGDGADPLHPEEELIAELAEAIRLVRNELSSNGFKLDDLIKAAGFAKNKALADAKEVINTDDESRKRFEISARTVFRKYQACLTFKAVDTYRAEYEAINFIYKTLQADRDKADTSQIVQKLSAIVSQAITVKTDPNSDHKVFDISKVNFELLQQEFERSEQKNSDVQSIKAAIEKRLAKMLEENPLRIGFQERYDEIVAEYNKEKDQNTIEATFEALIRLVAEMTEEQCRYLEEGFENEQQLRVFDMLRKPDLTKADIKKIKAVSAELLDKLRVSLESVQDTFAKQSTSDDFRQKIYDFLYDDSTGLPTETYTKEDIDKLTDEVYQHFYHNEFSTYSTAPAYR